MFIKELQISNYRLFPATPEFKISLSTPNGKTCGSGLTLLVGENGCGKSTLLDAIALPLVQFRAEAFSLNDLNNPMLGSTAEIKLLATEEFSVKRIMPNTKPFNAKGFLFKANLRKRDSKFYPSSIIVHDQLFIKADNTSASLDHSPDLRANVNNPFTGKRFDENEILILDENRIYQTRTGYYNPTRFDRLMEDFDCQYIKKKIWQKISTST